MRLWKKAGMAGVGALSLAGGLALPASPAGADELPHFLTVGGSLRIKDDERIERRSEYCNRGLTGTAWAQLPSSSVARVSDTNNGCGGEINVKVHVTGVLNHGPGWCVTAVVELYEGTNENPHDLDGSRTESACGRTGDSLQFKNRVRNTNEGGDWADYDVRVQLG